MSNIITVNDLCLWYGNTQALKNVNINIAKNKKHDLHRKGVLNMDNFQNNNNLNNNETIK